MIFVHKTVHVIDKTKEFYKERITYWFFGFLPLFTIDNLFEWYDENKQSN